MCLKSRYTLNPATLEMLLHIYSPPPNFRKEGGGDRAPLNLQPSIVAIQTF